MARPIVDAALAVASRKGLASTTVRDVAAEMGTSSGLIHHYFDSMDEVLAAAFERVAREDLIETEGCVVGVLAKGPDGPVEITSNLVLAADGRHSRMRAQADLARETFGAPMDVLWFRLSRRPDDDNATGGRFGGSGLR